MKKILLIIILSISLLPPNPTEAKTNIQHDFVKIIIQSNINSKYKSTHAINSKLQLRKIKSMEYISTLNYIPVSDAFLYLFSNGSTEKYIIDDETELVNVKSKRVYVLPERIKAHIRKSIQTLRKKHYGLLIPWNKVNTMIPKYSKFEIIDIDTGAKFAVQRRAGSNHADVQPLTRKDTKIMNKIYSGEWSWKRRAILIRTGKKLIAASMHGMPHGQGALINGFPGHFCVHFHLSKTHKRNIPDFAHNLMTLKAAGRTKEYFKSVTPDQLIDSFLLAIHQRDIQLLKMTTAVSQFSNTEKLFDRLGNVRTMKRMSFFSEIDNVNRYLFLTIPIEIQIITDNQYEKKMVTFLVFRESLLDSWKIDIKSISNQL